MKPAQTPKDFLTNCYTREGILPYLRKMEEEYVAHKRPFSILIMDVDHFKSFNDSYGHLMGDEVLKYFSSSMRLDLEDEENVPFRFGGDEFVMVFPHKTTLEAHRLATRLRKNIRTRSCLIKGRQIRVTFSGGIAGFPADATSIEDVLDKADKALYYSKNHGRGRITKYGDLGIKEFAQTAVIFLALVIIGGSLYVYRTPLSIHMARVGAVISGILPKTDSSVMEKRPAELVSQPVVTQNPAPTAPPKPPEPEKSKIYLESGRVIVGVIKNQDEDSLTVEIALKEGKGVLQIKKSQIVHVEAEHSTGSLSLE